MIETVNGSKRKESLQMRRIVFVFMAVLLAATSISCGTKVDCDKVGKRIFEECFDEFMVATGHVTKEQVEMFKKTDQYKEAQKEAMKQFMDKCKEDDGRHKDGDDINKCMKKKTCDEFADCIKPLMNK